MIILPIIRIGPFPSSARSWMAVSFDGGEA
jgi:hypothetical protein